MENDIEIEEKQILSKKNIIIALVCVGILVLLTVIVVVLSQLKTDKNDFTKPNKTSETVIRKNPAFLYFSPPSIKLLQKKQNGISSDIVLDTQGKGVAIVQMELSFDPSMISNVSVNKTDDLTSPFSEFRVDQTIVNQEKGKAFITLALNNTNTDKPKTGKGKLATIKYDVVNLSNKEKFGIQITSLTALINLGKQVKFEKTDLEITFLQDSTSIPR